jgi:hypothetical protein
MSAIMPETPAGYLNTQRSWNKREPYGLSILTINKNTSCKADWQKQNTTDQDTVYYNSKPTGSLSNPVGLLPYSRK